MKCDMENMKAEWNLKRENRIIRILIEIWNSDKDYYLISGVCYAISLQVFFHERLNGHYGVTAFVIGNTLSSLPFLFLIAITSGTLVYFLVNLHPGFGHYAYFILMLFTALACVESLMMAVSSVVGRNFLAGIVIGAGIQVCAWNFHPHSSFYLNSIYLHSYSKPDMQFLPSSIWRG